MRSKIPTRQRLATYLLHAGVKLGGQVLHDTFGSFRERHARFSMLFIASIPLPTLIRREIERQLTYQPELETKNRIPLLRASTLGSAWELRFGPENRFRVFYRTEAELRQVYILAVGMKVKERLFVGGKEFDL
jgi:hypothetical protein